MEVWEEIAADAQAGAARLVAEYGNRLFTAACRIVQNETDAEDLVFRTFEAVVAKIGKFDGRSQFFSWMYSVMLNFRRMDLRRKGANALVFDGEIPETEDPSPDPAEALAIKADAESIRAAVDRLAEPMRTVVVLRYFEEMELADIARAISAPLGTVKFRLHHARRELAEMLSQTFRAHRASNLAE